jgi:hypothetical protein
MKNTDIDTADFTVVIRAAGERTVEACRHRALEEFPEDAVHVIECKPFEAALRECYRIGAESGKKWMITIDADVLPRPGFASQIVTLSERVRDNVIMFNAIIHDKLMMSYRTGGVKVYNAQYLDEALKHVPEDGVTLRPEAATLKIMMTKGLKKKNFDYVIGLHDYEQFYKDVYRTAYFHATKHKEKVANLLADWKKASETDPDYLVAVKGAMDGFLSEGDTKSDVRIFAENSEKAVEQLGLKEKDSIIITDVSRKIEDELKNAGPFYRMFEINGIKNEFKSRGFFRAMIWYTGLALETTGKKIKNW